jgi:glycosyltransferase involved in cell wall biosynthesis
MSFALPIIGTDVGGVPEAVIDGETRLIRRKNHTAKDVATWIKKKF